jgi:hypothetical protein
MKRKSPIKHKVRNHKRRDANHVRSYVRGEGEKEPQKRRIKTNPFVKKRKIPKPKSKLLNYWPREVKEGEPLQIFRDEFRPGEPLDYWKKDSKHGEPLQLWPEKFKEGDHLQIFRDPFKEGEPLDYWKKDSKETEPMDLWGEKGKKDKDQKSNSKPTTKTTDNNKPLDLWGEEQEPTSETETKPFDYWGEEPNKTPFNPYATEESSKQQQTNEKSEKEGVNNLKNKKESSSATELVKKTINKQKTKKSMDLQEKSVKKAKKEVYQYTRPELERIFLGASEEETKKRAEELNLTFEEERIEPHTGEKVLEYRYPLETDWGTDASDRPIAFEEVDFTINLQSGEVNNVFTQQVSNPSETGGI